MNQWLELIIMANTDDCFIGVLLPGKSHGWRSLVGCSPWGREESDTTEQLHFSLSCIGEGNGNPLQCSCLENPRDGGAWWAAIYGVAQSRTRLKQFSSSSSSGGKGTFWLRNLRKEEIVFGQILWEWVRFCWMKWFVDYIPWRKRAGV